MALCLACALVSLWWRNSAGYARYYLALRIYNEGARTVCQADIGIMVNPKSRAQCGRQLQLGAACCIKCIYGLPPSSRHVHEQYC